MQQLLVNTDQFLKFKLDIASSIEEIYQSNEPMLKHLNKGCSITAEMNVISNVRKAILTILKEEKS